MPNIRAAARIFLAAALTFAVAAGAAPLGPAFGAHGCSMPCCKGPDGQAGDCKGGSCPISHFGKAKAKPPQPAHSDHSSHAGVEATPHDDTAVMHHAEPAHHSSHGEDADTVEHAAHGDVSTRDIPAGLAVAAASVSKPCPPDCGGIPNASTQLRRARDVAALPHKLRPRPPGGEVCPRRALVVAKTSSALRRQYPPRAPPTVSTGRPA